MCGRFGLGREAPKVAHLLGISEADLSFHRPRYNIAPTQEHFVVISEYERRKVHRANWGLVNASANDSSRAAQCINAMAETIEVKASLRNAFRKRSCIVPADGFYDGRARNKSGGRFGFTRKTAAFCCLPVCMRSGNRRMGNLLLGTSRSGILQMMK
jgi:putative SOS response-associated peptidase YedK